MMKKLLGSGRMVCEVTERDIEKAEQSTKLEITKNNVEKADSSTKPKEPEQDIDEAESSTKREITKKDVEKADSSTKLKEPEEDIDKAESSTKLKEPEEDIDKAESSTKLKEPEQDIDEAESSTKLKEPEQDIEKAESSTKPEITVQADEEVMEILKTDGAKSTNREGEGSCCIFKIPESLRKIKHKGYEPEIVSIGPYHHGKEPLQKIEKHKHRFLQIFLKEAATTVEDLEMKILEKVNLLKNSYSEKLEMEQPKLLKMMLLDGCFILMLFFFVAKNVKVTDPNDPILTTPWILATIRSDLLLLENQVPLILLQILLQASLKKWDLKKLAFKFFNPSLPSEDVSRISEAEHLLDLIRKKFIPIPSSNGSSRNATKESPYSRLILSAKRLRLQGIKFKASHDHSASKVLRKKVIGCFFNESTTFVPRIAPKKTILEIKLDKNELHIPPLVVDEFVSSVLLNCVAFEQLSANCSNDITSYVAFMGCLVNDEADATYLSEKGIIENYIGNASDVSQFFKNIRNGSAFEMDKSYLKEAFEGINKYTSSRWNVECARFMHLHFDSPWTLIASSVALLGISLSILQATLAVLRYLNK